MLLRITSPTLGFAALAVAVVSLILGACAYGSKEVNDMIATNQAPPIELMAHNRVETATFSLG